MAGEALDFKSQFYNLEGIHVNERKKSLSQLLRRYPNNIDNTQIDIQPRNYLERIFYVDVLIHFRKTEELTKILKEGNGVLTSKILKEKWFFQQVFEKMDEKDIVYSFLPSLSCSLRAKVLKKLALSLTEEKMDKIVEHVLARYGINATEQILFSCSESKFLEILSKYDLNLQPEQLKRILQKNPELIKKYFEKYKDTHGKDYGNIDFLNYLCWKQPTLYFGFELNKKQLKLGRYTTRNVLKNNQDEVIKDISIQQHKLKKSVLTRDIEDFHIKCLSKLLPEKLQDLESFRNQEILNRFISTYPKKKRFEIMSQVFKIKYNKNLEDHLQLFNRDFAWVFPENIRHKWASLMYTQKNDSVYLSYYPPKLGFEIIKEKLNLTSNARQRSTYLNQLIPLCYINKDYATYEEVLKYISIRHRNDGLEDVLRYIYNNSDPELFTANHWKYIRELIDIETIKGRFPINANPYLVYLVEKNLPLDEVLKQHMRDRFKIINIFRLNDINKPKIESILLRKMEKLISDSPPSERKRHAICVLKSIMSFNEDFPAFSVDLNTCENIIGFMKETCKKEEPYEDQDFSLISSLLKYNSLNLDNSLKICDDDRLLEVIKQMGKNKLTSCFFYKSIDEFIAKQPRTEFGERLLDLYLSDFFGEIIKQQYYITTIVPRLLQNEPSVFKKYLHSILKNNLALDLLKYRVIKNYSHLGLDRQIINHFIPLVNAPNDNENLVFKALSNLMDTKEYIDIIQTYLPREKKLNLRSEDDASLYKIQVQVIKSLKNLSEPLQLIPVLPTLLQGDYLQISLKLLYRILNQVNENEASGYVESLKKQPVSLRKHSVSLGFILLPINEAVSLFNAVSKTENNISVKKYLLRSILKYFIRNPSPFLLDIVVSNLENITVNDDELLQEVAESVNKVPNRYKCGYVEKVWDRFEEFNDDLKLTNSKLTVLRFINQLNLDLFLNFDERFCEKVIKKYFLTENTTLNVNGFVLRYLVANQTESRFKFVFEIIKNYKNKHDKTMKLLFTFFNSACNKFDSYDVSFLKTFTQYWHEIFTQTEHFSGYCDLKLLEIYRNNVSNVQAFAKDVNEYFEALTSQYGHYINLFLFESVNSLFSRIHSGNSDDFTLEKFAVHLLKANMSEMNCFIAMNIVKEYNDFETNEVIEILKEQKNHIGEVFYYSLLKQYSAF